MSACIMGLITKFGQVKNQEFCKRNVTKDQTKTIQKIKWWGYFVHKMINFLNMLGIERIKNKESNIFMERNQNSVINYMNNLPLMKF